MLQVGAFVLGLASIVVYIFVAPCLMNRESCVVLPRLALPSLVLRTSLYIYLAFVRVIFCFGCFVAPF